MAGSVALPPIVAVCGLYCGACYHYRAGFPEGAHLLRDAARGGRPLAGYTCMGCRSDQLYMHPGCAACAIRACAEAHDVTHCGLCEDFPCAQLKAFQSDGRAHHLDIVQSLEQLREVGIAAWMEEQAQRWQCTCGAALSWYEAICPKCGKATSSYPVA